MEPRRTRDLAILCLAHPPEDYTCIFAALWESARAKENFAPVEFEPMTSGLDLSVLYPLSYEASTGVGRGNLGSEFALYIQMI